MDRSELAVRMKTYEKASRRYLTRRMPVILRIDGKAFHTFTKGMKRPFDDIVLLETMRNTMKYLCENIQGCVLGYTQSDEITLVLVDYQNINTSAWYDNCQNKIESIAASMATMAFNKFFEKNVDEWGENNLPNYSEGGTNKPVYEGFEELMALCNYYREAIKKGAMFDCRAFNIPKEDVCNNLIWRQQDATRNSIQQIAHTYFSDKEIYKKKTNEIQDMLMTQRKINWNDYPTHLKRGSCCIKEEYLPHQEKQGCENNDIKVDDLRTRWVIDKKIPIFTQNRDYIESRIYL